MIFSIRIVGYNIEVLGAFQSVKIVVDSEGFYYS